MSGLTRTFILGILLGIGGAVALANLLRPVNLHREMSLVSVQPNGGNSETFRINLPHDRILVGLAGANSAMPADLEWPGKDLLGNLQAEMFKVRNRNDVVIGVASRLASASEVSGPFIQWALHLPARGTIYMQMEIAASAGGHRNGTLLAGTRDFEALSGSVREQFITGRIQGQSVGEGRIELITEFVRPFDHLFMDETI